jgi:flagella basal body P-ring formation protein FlgA
LARVDKCTSDRRQIADTPRCTLPCAAGIGTELALSAADSNSKGTHVKAYLLAKLGMAVGATATAAQFQDLDALDARVAMVLAGSRTAAPIDRRIKLAMCPDEPVISSPSDGAVSVRCKALGWRLRVTVTGSSDAAAPAQLLVRRGDTIELVAHGAGYSVSAVGIALEAGPAGASIRVKITTSSSPIAAVVARAGVASLPN